MDWIIRCFAAHVAALDLLGELDLLRRRQQRMPAGFAEEELERVGRRLVRERHGLGGRFGELLDHVDPALLELAVERVGLDRVEPVGLDQVSHVREGDRARLLGLLDEQPQILVVE